MTNSLIAMLAFVLLAGTPSEKKVQLKDVPAAVRSAIEVETTNATLKGVSKETEHGQTFYEAETMRDGRTRDLLFDERGTLVEVEEEVSLDSAPAAVMSALEGKGRLVKLESVTKGAMVTYEAHVSRNGKTSEIALDGNGRPVKQ
jgi:hypothetical protein